jgi:predicted RNA-binding Zn-ribbon protein involved in translation (DUF1610 family)
MSDVYATPVRKENGVNSVDCPNCGRRIIAVSSTGSFLCSFCGKTLETFRLTQTMVRVKQPDREPKVFVVPVGKMPPDDFDPDYDVMLRPHSQRNKV